MTGTLSFAQKEFECEKTFNSLTNLYHCCTPEDYEIIFSCPEEFNLGMWILAICAKLHPTICIYTFQLMSNHLHLILSGDPKTVEKFFTAFKAHLSKGLQDRDRLLTFKNLNLKLNPIGDLDYFRSSIAYVNRNGFVINDDTTPYSYPWGPNPYFFNHEMKNYYRQCRQVPKVADLRRLFHSKQTDDAKGLFSLDGKVSPMSFCDIQAAESAFRDAKHYFFCVSRNVESYSKIAASIGESVCYTDDDIYAIARNFARDKSGNTAPALLPPDLKIELASKLHHQYHAGKKQIIRILKLGPEVLDSLF